MSLEVLPTLAVMMQFCRDKNIVPFGIECVDDALISIKVGMQDFDKLQLTKRAWRFYPAKGLVGDWTLHTGTAQYLGVEFQVRCHKMHTASRMELVHA